MTGKTLDLEKIMQPDQLAVSLSRQYQEWDIFRAQRKVSWEEIQRYIYSTDTTTTANGKLPWKNSTTIPKLCQIRDNLYANYMAALFPKEKSVVWEASSEDDQEKAKAESIESYINYVLRQPENRLMLSKAVLDYIDYGDCIGSVEWTDDTIITEGQIKTGYVGPTFVRTSPADIVFNPTAAAFGDTPKMVRTLLTIGELKKYLDQETKGDQVDEYQKVYDYLIDLRANAAKYSGQNYIKNALYSISGFTSLDAYLRSNYIEIITFVGDYFDIDNKKLYTNYVITVADRHKIVGMKPNPSLFGKNHMVKVGWRIRPDNLYSMGPLENLVGMQYRIDHIENLKADIFDLVAAPPLKIKGLVEDFKWAPFARIMVGDDGDVEMLAPDANILQANLEIKNLMDQMEEMAGSPKEAAGFRTPGEKTAYEVQRLENAASRIFYSKILQFEEQFLEPLLNNALELSRRKMTSELVLRVFNEDTNATTFLQVGPEDLAGLGKIRPVAARNFAEKAEQVQNLTAFFQGPLGVDPDIKAHFSTIGLARLFENLLDITEYQVVRPWVRLEEEHQAQQLMQTSQQLNGAPMQGMQPPNPKQGPGATQSPAGGVPGSGR